MFDGAQRRTPAQKGYYRSFHILQRDVGQAEIKNELLVCAKRERFTILRNVKGLKIFAPCCCSKEGMLHYSEELGFSTMGFSSNMYLLF